MTYLSEMAKNTPSAANILPYAHIVREHSTVRRLITAANDISRLGHDPAGLDASDLLQLVEKHIQEISEGRPKQGGLEAMELLLKRTVQRIDTLFRSKSDITGLITRDHEEPRLIVVDYLQLMQTASNNDGRTQEISEISRPLKAIAKEYHCPVIALSQLNRAVEARNNKRPINSDLKESGAIEQDADVIIFIYRDEKYNEDSPDKGTAELIIGKQRNGETGTCSARFIGEYTRFEDDPRLVNQESYY